MSPIDTVLSRIEKPRANGAERWRSACPSCGGSNRSALSVGVGSNGAVLMTCWKGCSIEEICSAIGVEVTELFPPKDAHASTPRRRNMLSAGQALELLEDEANLVFVAAGNIAAGVALTPADLYRVAVAAGRISYLRSEARA